MKPHLRIAVYIAAFIVIELSIIKGFAVSRTASLVETASHDDLSRLSGLYRKSIDKYYGHDPSIAIAKVKMPPDESMGGLSTPSAEDILIKSAEKNPLNPGPFYELALIWNRHEKKNARALVAMERAVSLRSTDVKFNVSLADFYKERGMFDDALEYYKKALSLPAIIRQTLVSDIYCSMAEIYLLKGDYDLFEHSLAKARSYMSDNWKVNIIEARAAFLKRDGIDGALNLRKAYHQLKKTPHKYPVDEHLFEREINKTAGSLIKSKLWDEIRMLYDAYASLGTEHERILLDLGARFSALPGLTEQIWGERISLRLLGPHLGDSLVLKNENRGCPLRSKKHFSAAPDREGEALEVDYSNSAGFIDLWYIPLSIPVSSERLSATMTIISNTRIEPRQIAVELGGNLYYSEGTTNYLGNSIYILESKNILKYAEPLLQNLPKDYTVKLTKAGFNTVCKSGRYILKSIEIYLED